MKKQKEEKSHRRTYRRVKRTKGRETGEKMEIPRRFRRHLRIANDSDRWRELNTVLGGIEVDWKSYSFSKEEWVGSFVRVKGMKSDVAQVVDATPDTLKIVLLKNEEETIVKIKDCVPYINVQDVMADLGLKSSHEDCVFRTDIILNLLSRSRDTTFSSESSKDEEEGFEEDEEEEEKEDAEFLEEDVEEDEIESPEIKTLCDMGFKRDVAKRAISAAKGDLQQAALLCIEPVEAPSPPSLTQQVSESKEGETKSEYSDEDLMWRRTCGVSII